MHVTGQVTQITAVERGKQTAEGSRSLLPSANMFHPLICQLLCISPVYFHCIKRGQLDIHERLDEMGS